MTAPLRAIEYAERYIPKYAPNGSAAYKLNLVCGHHVYRKASQISPHMKAARCRDCEEKLRLGG